jgi:predicted membrane chloride channel (bestrophin family)
VSETYSFDNFFTEINRTYRLLTDREVDRMRQINMDTGGAAYLELLTWCLQEIEISHQAENAGDHPLATQLRSTVTALRDRLATLYNFDDQPVPFFYVHFTCLVSVYYLPLFAVDTALSAGVGADANWVSEIVAALIVLLQLIFVIGLRVLAIKLANPYGSDNEDLSVIFYVRTLLF